jgi:hypothetical protein
MDDIYIFLVICKIEVFIAVLLRTSEQTVILSLYSINLSGFINEAESVYCEVQAGCFISDRYSVVLQWLRNYLTDCYCIARSVHGDKL